ncbi:MAG: TonB-dependent receptor [Deltaproteobacteria bacterium]|nr:TonB-dependent receptor [Deltaproteobacteria bacterium]
MRKEIAALALWMTCVAGLWQLPTAISAAETGQNVAKSQERTVTPEARSYGAIKGIVVDKKTQKALPGVIITLKETRKGATTNKNGEFTLSRIQIGQYTLILDNIGYSLKIYENISVVADEIVDLKFIELDEQPIPNHEIVVTPGNYSIMGSERSLRQTLTSEDIKIMGWAEDITRAIQKVPGISANDFSAKFNVRGGDVDEVLVILDGMQIYKPFHQKDFGGGLFSTVDIETIDGLDLMTGGYTAEYGSRMSGVLDMHTKNAKEGESQTSIGASLMNLRAFSMGTFNGDKGSWLFSARLGYLDILNKLTGNQFKLHPNYYDILGKAEYKLNEKHTLSAHVFLANDSYRLNERIVEAGNTDPNIDYLNTKYGDNYGWLTLDSTLSSRLFARTLLYGGYMTQKRVRDLYDDDPEGNFNSCTVNDDRHFDLFGLKQDWTYEVSKNIFMKFGFDAKKLHTKFTYSNSILNEFITADHRLTEQIGMLDVQGTEKGDQLGFYLSSRFKIFNPLTLETGLRYDYSSYTGDKLWSPRIALVYSLAKATFLRAGWGYYYQTQDIDDLRIEFGENSYFPARLAEHYVLGLEHRFNNGLQFRAEAYVKKISNLPATYLTFRNIDEFFPETRDDLIKLDIADATAKGIELYLKYDTGNKFSWWLSYVLSDTRENVSALNYEGPLIHQTGILPRPWDQRHTIVFETNYRPNDKWHFNIGWQFRSGWPYTPFEVDRIARDNGTFAYYHDYGLFNSLRYPPYHRLDIRINRQFFRKRGKTTVFLQIINAYNHKNINNYDFSILEQNADSFRYEIDKETWFPILPLIGVSWEF